MNPYSLSHLSDGTLLRDLAALVARDRATTAALLAHIAEVDHRRLYLPAGYPSMYAYCVDELRLSEEAAYKRIHAARAARRFPALFAAVAEGRLHLSAIILLAPWLSPENAQDLMAAAIHRSKAEIERLLAERFPRPGVLAWVEEDPAPSGGGSAGRPTPGLEAPPAPGRVGVTPGLEAPSASGRVAPPPVPTAPGSRPMVKPLGPGCVAVQFTLSRTGHDKLRHAQALLGHQVPSGDLAQVFERALDALIARLEKRKCAATSKLRLPGPRHGRPAAGTDGRHIPAEVRRAVWKRDGGRCTFVSETGRRCPARSRLEFDHVQEVARGGGATISGIRLLCRAHNQFAAECAFGEEFMRHKRLAAAEARAAARERAMAGERAAVPAEAATPAGTKSRSRASEGPGLPVRPRAAAGPELPVRPAAPRAGAPGPVTQHAPGRVEEQDVVPWLRALGFRPDEARRAAARCEGMPDASLEERVRLALSFLAPPHRRLAPSPATAT